MTIPDTLPASSPTPGGTADHLWIPPKIEAELRADQQKLQAEGWLPSRQQLQIYYDTFRRRFGPEALRGLDGLALLEQMHAHGNRDSLVYWLEFKNDEDFPEIFGSSVGEAR